VALSANIRYDNNEMLSMMFERMGQDGVVERNDHMELKLKVNRINYGNLAEKFLPMLSDKLAKEEGAIPRLLSKLAALSPGMAKGMLNVLPDETKNEMVVYLINKNKQQILDGFARYMREQGIDIEIGDLSIEA
jgi:hypothetical protein